VAGGTWRVNAGGANSNSAAGLWSEDTVYHVWVRYVEGSGADAIMQIYHSLDATRPGSATVTRNTGTAVEPIAKVRLRASSSTTVIYDKWRVANEEIGSATNDIMQDSMDFDEATDEFVGAWFTLPSWYVSGNVAITFHWTAASGSGDVYWTAGIRAYPEGEAMDQSITLPSATPDTLTTAGDMHVGATFSSEAIQGTGEAANVPCYIKISRDADNGSDNLAVDAKLLGVTITFP